MSTGKMRASFSALLIDGDTEKIACKCRRKNPNIIFRDAVLPMIMNGTKAQTRSL